MKCAIVDAYGIAKFLPAALRRYGVECVHVRSEHPDVYSTYQPEDFTVDIEHVGDIAETASLLHGHGTDYVVAGSESGVLLADRLSAELDLPGNGMLRPEARRNKYQMVLAVREAGLAAANSLASSSIGEIIAWVKSQDKWPIVLKPLASAGTDNVIFCRSVEEIHVAYATIEASIDRYGRRNDAVLVQEYLAGEEYFVNTVSRNGVHYVVGVWHYHKIPVDDCRSINDFEHPISSSDPIAREISEYTFEVLDSLENRNGAAHTEVMLTKNGPVLVECGARLGGSQLPAVVSRALGTEQVESLAMAIARPEKLAEHVGQGYQLLTNLRYVSLINPRDGAVPFSNGFASVRSLISYTDMALTLPEGSRLPRTIDLATSPGFVYLCSDDPHQVEVDYSRLRELERNGLYDGTDTP
jgi:biotin carboxylase